MPRVFRHAPGVVILALLCTVVPRAAALQQPTTAQFLKPGLPIELVSARKADRIAWIAYEEGKRNVFTAAAPNFVPVRVTSFLQDDGTDLTGLRISGDGTTLYHWTNAGDIDRRHIWAVPTSGGSPKQITAGDGMENNPVHHTLGELPRAGLQLLRTRSPSK